MQIKFGYIKFFIFFYIIPTIVIADLGENDLKCLEYKKLIYEETKTYSYFLPGAKILAFTEDHCSTATGFVVGGKNARPKEFPFAARLGHRAYNHYVNWFCGGTLVSENYVLTAAHCFYTSLGEVNVVRLGELDFDSDNDDAKPQDFRVKQLIEHPAYNYNQPYNDIGLIMLSARVKFDRYKHPACLPTNLSRQKSNIFTAIGWGHTEFAGRSSSHLQKVTLKSLPYADCQRIAAGPDGQEQLPNGLKPSQLCAGSTEAKDTCQGDSGGPLLVRNTRYPCMFHVVGITSLGISGCGIPNVPAVYTNVSFYIDWISDHIHSFT